MGTGNQVGSSILVCVIRSVMDIQGPRLFELKIPFCSLNNGEKKMGVWGTRKF